MKNSIAKMLVAQKMQYINIALAVFYNSGKYVLF